MHAAILQHLAVANSTVENK